MTLLLRRWACSVAEHHRPLALAASVAGMAGFVLSTAPLGWLDRSESTVLWGSLASLSAYGFALGVGHLGDPWELARREGQLRTRATFRRRVRAGVRGRRPTPIATRSFT